MRVVGLTGGIASGKSSVSREFQKEGIPVVDADKIARDVLRKNTYGYKRVVKVFGKNILLPDGEVDRPKLGDIVFADAGKRKQLNDALGPAIARSISWEVIKHWLYGTRVLILDVPLLFETGMNRFTHPVIVVWIDPESEETRLMARDNISKDQAQNRIRAQQPLDWKREKADIVIDNSGSPEQTKEQINVVLKKIKEPFNPKEVLCSRNFVGGVAVVVVMSALCKWWHT